MSTRVLVIGGGGREHALAWRLSVGGGRAPARDREVLVAPGNAGIARELSCLPLKEAGLPGFVRAAKESAADLVVVGPEQPLVDGLVDALAAEGIAAIGPTAACARLEGSKAFMKDLAARAGVPTARYGVFTALPDAERFLDGLPFGAVVKADGLAAGKGVTVCEDAASALKVAREYLGVDGRAPRFGAASRRIVIEEFLPGLEVSVIALCDGERAVPFACSRDHKRLLAGDRGPNTGGMGAVCPLGDAEGVTEGLLTDVQAQIFAPTLAALAADGTPYRGFLYAGLMVHEGQAKLLEFNVRFGDPEAEAVLFGTDVDLLEPFLEVARGGGLAGGQLDLAAHCRESATVVCASEGYPEAPRTGDVITGLDEAERTSGAKVFYAGVREVDGRLVTAGGRVLTCSADGETLEDALARAYQAVDALAFAGKYARRDIGHSVIGRSVIGRSVGG